MKIFAELLKKVGTDAEALKGKKPILSQRTK
jgi:hypothetical protein